MKTVVGLFDNFEDAQGAVRELRNVGFAGEDLSMIMHDEGGQYARHLESGEKENLGSGAAAGAGIGAVLGGLGGLLVGLGALAIPGIGPVLAAGPIATTLAGAGVGALAGGIVGALVDLGIPEEHANLYAEGIRRGGTLVVVRTSDEMADQAADVMNRFHPVDIDRRSTDWRQQNWTRFDESAGEFDRSRLHNRSSNIPVTGEEDMGTGVMGDMSQSGRGQTTGAYGTDRDFTGGTMSDRTRRDMDIHEDDRDIPVTGPTDVVYSESVEETITPLDENWTVFDNRFRTDYRARYGTSGQDYTYYQPAYRFGYDLAMDPRYRDWDWDRIEPMAQQEWQRKGLTGRWEDFKDHVRAAWDRVTNG